MEGREDEGELYRRIIGRARRVREAAAQSLRRSRAVHEEQRGRGTRPDKPSNRRSFRGSGLSRRLVEVPRATAARTSGFGSRRLMRPQRIAEPTWSELGGGEPRWFLGTLATIRIPGEAVDGRFALIEFLFPKHASPPRHTHPQDESYVVLDGLLAVESGEHRFTLTAGGVAVIPMGVTHTFRVD